MRTPAPTLLAAALLAVLLAACKTELVCATGQAECGGRCVSLALDSANCGACGNACGAGTVCSAGTCSACAATCTSTRGCAGEVCQPDLFVGCPATSELLPRAADLTPAGSGRSVTAGLTALTSADGFLFSASGFPAAAVDIVPMDPAQASRRVALAGSDLEGIAVHGGVTFVSNAATGTLAFLGAGGALLDELPLPGQQSGPNPHGITFVGSKAYVALTGYGPGSGQAIAVVDLAGLSACSAEAAPPACGAGDTCDPGRHCVAGACRLPCASVSGSIDLSGVAGSSDAPGLPFPGRLLSVGTKVYATLANLKIPAGGSFYMEPAGSGRLAVVDTAAGDAVSIVDLGASCGNPGNLALQGTTLWVSCGSFGYSAAWPGRLVPVSIAGAPAVGSAVSTGDVLPNGISICGGRAYLGDMASGKVLPFDLAARAAGTAVEVCPLNAPPGPPDFGYAYVADVACAP
ncbi:MAG: hypothetical protein HZB56_06620 [Deltaproteobacteria bacterium]|nr:hypothetical protein [Deltaproteobacteria bacterium]